jgi:hypothetical protein
VDWKEWWNKKERHNNQIPSTHYQINSTNPMAKPQTGEQLLVIDYWKLVTIWRVEFGD